MKKVIINITGGVLCFIAMLLMMSGDIQESVTFSTTKSEIIITGMLFIAGSMFLSYAYDAWQSRNK